MNVRDWAVMFGRQHIISFLEQHYPEQHGASILVNSCRFIQLAMIFMFTSSRVNLHL